MRIAVIGCGVIGTRRAKALPAQSNISACLDTNIAAAEKLANEMKARCFSSFEDLLSAKVCDAVIIATINKALVPLMQRCIENNLPLLVEKPGARSYAELSKLKVPSNFVLKVGFNHRFHPAFLDLRKELAKNPEDPIMYIRGRYGNGARVGFDKEWRSNVDLAGGGELLDQGVHLLDLASCLLPDLKVRAAHVRTLYWNMPVDDNAWAILETPKAQTFSMHVSSTEWKNEFLFEVYTRNKKFVWSGLGRSYGPETLTIYSMKPEMGPPDIERRDYPGEDLSWLHENQNFVHAIEKKEEIWGGLRDAEKSLSLVNDIYHLSTKHWPFQEKASPQFWQS